MTAPLDGVRVIEFGQFIAAPAATQLLVDLGADVIKVEPVHGESSRHIGIYGESILATYNRNKRAIAVDLKSDHGQEIARDLIADAEIVVQNLRPGVMDSFGLGAEAICAAHPHIVYASVSGFGANGPSKHRAGLDIAAQAESGIMWVTGEADGEPQRVGFPVVDVAAAHIFAQAILGAYIRRLRTGRGDVVETSLLAAAIHLQGPSWGEYLITGVEPMRNGNGQPAIAPAADVMPTSDGAVVISAYSVVHFRRLCELIGRPDLPTDPRFLTNELRVQNRATLLVELRREFAPMTSDEAMALLTPNGVVAGRISGYADVRRNPDVVASGIFIDVVGSAGIPQVALGSPWHLGSIDGLSPNGSPGRGQHTDEILSELGYTNDRIDEAIADGVVFSAGAAVSAAV